MRAQTAAEVELDVRNMAEAATEFDAAAARLSEYTSRAVPWLFEVRRLNDFVNVGRAQVPPAVDLVGQMLRAYADDIIAGKAPATLPCPEESALSQANDPAPKPERVAKIVPDAASAGLVAANFQPLDRGPDRVLKVTP